MSKRIFNILFHLHTVSGIVISVALYVIFFAGAFSFFRDEIVNWERGQTDRHPNEIHMDYDQVIDSLSRNFDLYGREISFSKSYNEPKVNVSISASLDTLVADSIRQKAEFFYLNTETLEQKSYVESYTLGEFLYRLHFFAQIPYPAGYYLSGFTAFFFLFAIITGLIVHWDKIIKNFYLFRPWAKLKTVWTDAHTALGLIGLPFQFVYAVTGAFFMLNVLLVGPSVFALYDGDKDKLYDDLGFNHPSFELQYKKLTEVPAVEDFIKAAEQRWDDLNVLHVIVHNYGDKSMHVTVEGRPDFSDHFSGVAEITYHVESGIVASVKDHINEASYLDSVKILLYQLHYGDYGRLGLRIVSFVLGLISCFVILSGVLIWVTARERKDVPEKKKKFNRWVGWIYLSVCLSMYPVTALTFIAVKVFDPVGQSFLYSFYFLIWLATSIFFSVKKSNFFTNKYTLLSGGILGLCVPVINGIKTGQWLWLTIGNGYPELFLVDILWVVLGAVSIFVALRVKRSAGKNGSKEEFG